MESEPIRDRASLLTSARLRPWRSNRPLSAVEDEAARVRSPSGMRVAPCEWVSITPSSAMEDETVMEAVPDSKSGERVTVGVRVLRLPLATTQLVEGACLIRRYRAVRSRGGQLWRDSSGGQSALLITGRPRVRIPLSLPRAGSSVR